MINTKNKRMSIDTLPWSVLSPDPDGDIGEADRLQLNWLYSGFSAAGVPFVVPDIDQDLLRLVRLAWKN